jgi:hypothetical protein
MCTRPWLFYFYPVFTIKATFGNFIKALASPGVAYEQFSPGHLLNQSLLIGVSSGRLLQQAFLMSSSTGRLPFQSNFCYFAEIWQKMRS